MSDNERKQAAGGIRCVQAVEDDIPGGGGAGVWQYISLPRGSEEDRPARTLRTGYCEADIRSSRMHPPGDRTNAILYGSSDVRKSEE